MHLEFDCIKRAWTKKKFSGPPFVPYEQQELTGEADFYFPSDENRQEGRYLFASYLSDSIFLWTDSFGFRKGYYKVCDKKIIFTSEPQVVLNDTSGFTSEGIALLLLLGYVPPPTSLYKEWNIIPPGFRIEINLNTKKIKKERVWKFNKKKGKYDIFSFQNLLEKTNTKLANKQSVSLLLSGGIDSRLISYSLKNVDKTNHFLKIDNFIPSLEDETRLLNSPEKINRYTLNLNDLKIRDLYRQSTLNALDHSHMGRFKFLYLMQELSKYQPGSLVFNGQTADTLLMKNLTGDGKLSKCNRLLFSNFAKSLFLMPKISGYGIHLAACFARGNKKKLLKQLALGTVPQDFFSGYFLNAYPFPGIDPGYLSTLKQGMDSIALARECLNNLIKETWDTYDGNVNYFLPDLLLRTFIYGMDMRGIEDASYTCSLRPRFTFMTQDMAEFLVNLPTKLNKPTGLYKKYFKDVLYHCYQDENKPVRHQFQSGFQSLESKMNQTLLGNLFYDMTKEKMFPPFLDHLQQHRVTLPLKLFDQLKKETIHAHDFIFLDRLFSLYQWWKSFSMIY